MQDTAFLAVIHQSEQVHHDPRKGRLCADPVLVGNVAGLQIEVYDSFVEPDVENRRTGRKVTRRNQPVDHLALETDPILLPTRIFERTVGMPHPGKKEKHLAFLDSL